MQIRLLLTTLMGVLFANFLIAQQNVFNPNDPIVRYSASAALGTAQKPNPNTPGLQKWVSTPTTGISTGGGSWDNSSFKAYFLNVNGDKMAFRVKFPKNYSNPAYADSTFKAMVFFHGAGEFACNSNNGYYNNEKQLTHGANFFRQKVDNGQFDGFLIYPQFNTQSSNCWGSWGGPSNATYGLIVKFLDSLAKYARLDLDRIIATGLSAGGSAAWHAASSYPRYFAKTAPSAASAPGATKFDDMVHVPVWMATGGKDTSPTPSSANASYQQMKNRGADIIFTLYENLGHSVWTKHWNEPGFMNFMNNLHKANPLIFFQRNEFCPEDPVNTKIGITAGYHSYEWQKDGVTIATKIGNTLTVYDNTSVANFTGNEMVVKDFGTYRVRFRRVNNGPWSDWSHQPAVISRKSVTKTPNIQVSGLNTKVLPAPNGKTTVALTLPNGYAGYQWYNANTEQLLATTQVFNAPPGEYKAKVVETYGCGTEFSEVFKVVDQSGGPKPDPAKSLAAAAISATSIKLNWNQNPNSGTNETGFEIYRALSKDGPFTLMHITAPDVTTWTDNTVEYNITYYYLVRAVNNNGAAANSNIASAKPQMDDVPPTPPSNLRYRGATQNSVELSWTAATDNGAIARYDIYANGVKMYSTTNTSITVFGLTPNTYYTFYVKAVDKGGNESNPSNQVMGYTHQQGLNYAYYEGNWDNLPNFNSITPKKTGVISNVSNGYEFRNVEDYYAVKWEGYIYIPESGTWTFYTSSDDGSKLYINTNYTFSATALVNNDGLHGTQERSGSISLTRGYHKIVITFFEKTGVDVMEVRWQNTAAGFTKEIIPSGFFALSPVENLPALPNANPSNLSVSVVSHNQLRLTWNDNANNETGYEIQRGTASGGPFVHVNSVGTNVNQYIDSGLNASTRYYYRVRAVNLGGASGFSNVANNITSAAPAAPATPTNISATALNGESIQISFKDNSSNETGFELWRSVGNTNNFILLSTLPAANGEVLNYTDTGLFANVTYYYRVRAKGQFNYSGYTATVNAKTLNTKPVLKGFDYFNVQRGTTYEFEIEAIDTDGDALSFYYLSPLPSYVTPNRISNNIMKYTVSPSLFVSGIGRIDVVVHDGFEGRDTLQIFFTVTDNAVPDFEDIPTINVSEGGYQYVDVQMTDDQEDYSGFNFWIVDLPDFVTVENRGNGLARIYAAPNYDHAGSYSGYLKVDDGYGGITFRKFNVVVTERDPNELVRVNFRYFTGGVPGWNDVKLPENPPVSSAENGNYFNMTNLVNTRGENSGIGIRAISGVFESKQGGQITGNNSGVFPDNILRDQMVFGFTGGNANDVVELKVTGLSDDKHYNFIFYGNYNCFGCTVGDSYTTYVINGDTAVVNFLNNYSNTDTIHHVVADENGEVIIKMIGSPNANIGGVLNALIIDARFDDGSVPAAPLNLQAEAVTNSGVHLSWVDVAYNEDDYKVYRSKNYDGPYEIVNTTGIYRDSTSFVDKTADPLTTYYYYVVGVNNYGYGPTSDTVVVETGNNNPTITSLTDRFMKSGSSLSVSFSVDDDPVDNLTVFILNKPEFVTLVPLGNNQFRIDFNPSVAHIGVYDIVAVVNDGKGGEARSSMKLYVNDKDTRTVYINFGEAGLEAPVPWNNFMGSRTTNSQLNNLRDENNMNTGYAIRFTGRVPTVFTNGMISGNNSGPYPDVVFESGVLKNPSVTTDGEVRFQGLNQNLRYNVYVISSFNEGTSARMRIFSGAQADTIEARYNSHKLASLTGLQPDANGYITVTMQALDGTMYLNGIVLEEYSASLPILSPVHLYAEATSRTSARIIWTDRSWNEDQNGGFILERANDPQFTTGVVQFNLGRNTDAYTDNTLQPNKEYYYRVRAKSGAVFSEYSNVSKITTAANIVYVNFNFQVDNAPAPWNNLQLSPDLEITIPNLKSESGVNTGVSFTIDLPFNGENIAGKQVGNIGFAPDIVLASSYWIDNTQLARVRLGGLSHAKKYRIGFFGSMSTNGWFKGNYTATYTIGDRTVYLNSWDNYTKIVYIDDVRANESGEIILDFSTTEAAAWGFNGGILIESYDDFGGTQGVALVNNGNETLAQRVGDGLDKMQVNVYPNPFVDNVQIEFNNESASNQISVDVYDLSGKLVHRENYSNLPVGMNALRMNIGENKLGSGIYLMAVKINGKTEHITKLIKTEQ